MKKKKLTERDLFEKKVATIEGDVPKFLRLQTDQVKLTNGILSTRQYIKHPGAALILPETKKNELLFIKQFRYPLKKVFWELPAGKMDSGENPLDTARRELQEEVGYEAKKMSYVTSIHPVIGYGDEVIHIYLAQGLRFVGAAPDEGELLIPQRMTLQSAMEKVRKHKITDVKTQIALFWYEKISKGLWSSK